MKKCRKKFLAVLSVFLLSGIFGVDAYADPSQNAVEDEIDISRFNFGEGTQIESLTFENEKGEIVTVNLPNELMYEITDVQIEEFVNNQEAGSINIYAIESIDHDQYDIFTEDSNPTARIFGTWLHTTTVTRRAGTTNFETGSRSIITVARGMSVNLSRSWSATSNLQISSGTPSSTSFTSNHSMTGTRSTSLTFNGPGESSSFRSRDFRMSFIHEHVNWEQRSTHSMAPFNTITTSGRGSRPIQILWYSRDIR